MRMPVIASTLLLSTGYPVRLAPKTFGESSRSKAMCIIANQSKLSGSIPSDEGNSAKIQRDLS